MLDIHPEVAEALRDRRPVVALESTLIAQGLPWPVNFETAREAEEAVRATGGIPATIAVWHGRPTIGLGRECLEELARSGDVLKASRRDLAWACARQRTAATTVAATLYLANRVGIPVFATGGIGGVHRGEAWDVSADLIELARTPVAVVCAGAKSILDLSRTLELLETLAVPVLGYQTDDFPAFLVRRSGLPVPARVDDPIQAAAVLAAHWKLDGAGALLAQPLDAGLALALDEFDHALHWAESEATNAQVSGKNRTPFLLTRVAEATSGRSLQANRALVVANARLAAEVAAALLVY